MIRATILRLSATAIPFLFGIAACTDAVGVDDRSSATDRGTTTLCFVGDPMADWRVTTRASDVKDEKEKKINQLHIFFFGSDGEYLKGGYLTGYPNAPEDGGYYTPGQGVNMLKIDNTKFENAVLASSATVYAVANVEADLFRDNDGDGRPDKIERLADLQTLVYAPRTVSLGLPAEGMPMVGVKVVDLTKPEETIEGERRIDMQALMARIDVSIQLASDVQQGNYPALTLVDWTARNLPTRVAFSSPDEGDETGAKWTAWTKSVTTPYQRTIYNKEGQIAFTFYMYENVQNAEWVVDEGEQWTDPSLANQHKGLYPDSIAPYQKQRYKPYLANDNAASIELHGYYSTYNEDGSGNSTSEVRYTLYLGANHTDDFSVKRNHQYKNDISIKRLIAHDASSGEYTFDARVNIEDEGNEFHISILRERNHDAHFCITPMDVYLFADEQARHPTMEVLLGDIPQDSEEPTEGSIPDWIRMEKVSAYDMENGTVSDSGFSAYPDGDHLATGTEWTAGNGKRAFFTIGMLKPGGALADATHATITRSRDRIYFYIDENLRLEDRSATVTLIYKENGQETKRRTIVLGQTHLLPVTMRDGGTLYMEQYEEYLDHYDPLDRFASEQIYTGLPWAERNSGLDDMEIKQLYKTWFLTPVTSTPYDPPGQVFNDGYPYTSYVIFLSNQHRMTLNDKPLSAFQYCHNRNKRNANGTVTAAYENRQGWGFDVYSETSNESKWFLPGIRQMEDALTQYYTSFSEFQDSYYWSSSAGEREGGTSGQSSVRARATKVLPDGNYVDSGGGDGDENRYKYELGRGGYARRTESLRIRAFRTDLDPVD